MKIRKCLISCITLLLLVTCATANQNYTQPGFYRGIEPFYNLGKDLPNGGFIWIDSIHVTPLEKPLPLKWNIPKIITFKWNK